MTNALPDRRLLLQEMLRRQPCVSEQVKRAVQDDIDSLLEVVSVRDGKLVSDSAMSNSASQTKSVSRAEIFQRHRTGKEHFSDRELQVLALLQRRYSSNEISSALGIAPATVQQHIRILMAKLRVRNRTGMLASAILLGLIEAPLETAKLA